MALLPVKLQRLFNSKAVILSPRVVGTEDSSPLGSERALTLHQLQPDAADTVVAKPA